MLLGAAARRRSVGLTALACLAALASVATHTLQGVILAGLFAGVVGAAVLARRPLPWRQLAVITGTCFLALAVFLLYLWPELRTWNHDVLWGYSPLRSLQGSVSQLGWPVVVLAVLGAVCLVRDDPEQGAYWVAFVGTWVGAAVVLPLVIAHALPYVFPQALSVVVLAGYFAGTVFQTLRGRGRVVAWAWLAAVCVLNLPGLLSYYQDGDRYDLRAAARFLEAHWRSGDRMAAVSSGIVTYYAPVARQGRIGIDGSNPLPRLAMEAKRPGRLWIVLTVGRAGYPEDVRRWLGEHCMHELHVRKRRLDYYDYGVDVFLHEAPGGAAGVKGVAQHTRVDARGAAAAR
jgi:hypothetical protein